MSALGGRRSGTSACLCSPVQQQEEDEMFLVWAFVAEVAWELAKGAAVAGVTYVVARHVRSPIPKTPAEPSPVQIQLGKLQQRLEQLRKENR